MGITGMYMNRREDDKRMAAWEAAKAVRDGMLLGLGSGSTVHYLFEALSQRKDLASLKVVASSQDSQQKALAAGLHVLNSIEADHLDLVIDGVDHITVHKEVIKGGGGALVREKILAHAAERILWIMDDSKLTECLEPYTLPVEILPFAYGFLQAAFTRSAYSALLRRKDEQVFVSDNGNWIVDVRIPSKETMAQAHQHLIELPGVVDTGYFHYPAKVIIHGEDGFTIWDDD